MSIRLPRSVLSLCALLLGGCFRFEPPPPPPPATEVLVAAPFDVVWPRVVRAFADNQLPVTAVDALSGLVASNRTLVGDPYLKRWANCGRVNGVSVLDADRGRFFRAIADVAVLARRSGDSTALRVTLTFQNRRTEEFRGTEDLLFDCLSNGEFERALLAQARSASP